MQIDDVTYKSSEIIKVMYDDFPLPVVLTDTQGIISYINKEFSLVTGHRDEDLFEASIEAMFHSDTVAEPVLGIFSRTGGEKCQLQHRIKTRSAESRRVNVQINNLFDGICFTITLLHDCPEVADLTNENAKLLHQVGLLTLKNDELIQENRDLARSNQELSQYAYVASHDLQEPLRKIRIFSDILTGSQQLNSKDRFIAEKINTASDRMSSLIRDLLNYSRLMKSDGKFEKVDLQEILKAVLVDFELTIDEKKAVITATSLPTLYAVRLQMNQLFYNLIGNALKFTAPGDTPRIEISATLLNSTDAAQYFKRPLAASYYQLIRFVDHGIGFDSTQAEEIFEVFKRLYPREQYEGSGIGLALCKRIVQNHSGVLFANSRPGEGSTFTIIIPQRAIS